MPNETTYTLDPDKIILKLPMLVTEPDDTDVKKYALRKKYYQNFLLYLFHIRPAFKVERLCSSIFLLIGKMPLEEINHLKQRAKLRVVGESVEEIVPVDGDFEKILDRYEKAITEQDNDKAEIAIFEAEVSTHFYWRKNFQGLPPKPGKSKRPAKAKPPTLKVIGGGCHD